MARKATKKVTATATKAAKASKGKSGRELPVLKNEIARAQLVEVKKAGEKLLKVVEGTTVVPVGYLRRAFADLGRSFRTDMTARHVDPVEKKKARLEAKIAKFQAELANWKAKAI